MAQMQETADQARSKVQEATGQAKSKARAQIDQRSTQAGERVSAAAADVRSVGDGLREQGKDGPARMADQVAERTERFGGYLRDADPDRMLADAEDFGRRQPWAVAAGGVLLGFAASRFLKASSRERYQASRMYGTGNGGSTYAGGPALPATPATSAAAGTNPGSGSNREV
jgi:hypothetical protein